MTPAGVPVPASYPDDTHRPAPARIDVPGGPRWNADRHGRVCPDPARSSCSNREAARTYVAADTSEQGSARAAAAAGIALRDQGFDDDPVDALTLSCSSTPCLEPGSDVAARVDLRVPLPFVPAFVRDIVPLEVPVSAERVAPVDAYRVHG